ncbi:MAP kinase, partial [Selaginella moellendorffii]
MRSLKGESRVVQFLGRVQTGLDDDRCIVMELAYNLSLRALLDASGQSLSGRLKVVIARDLCGGLCSLHGRGIAHEDVKSDNVLLDFGLRAKLCDFGTARQMGDEKRAAPPGSMYHRLASDIYSLGLVLQELCLASCPLERPSCDEVLDALDHLYSSDDRDFDSFKGLLDHAIGEAERVNLACYWTDAFMDPFSVVAGVVGLVASIDSIINLLNRVKGLLERLDQEDYARMVLAVEIYKELRSV